MVKQNFNKKGQMKIQQMAFMLIAITIFFVLVAMFFLTIVFSNVKKTATQVQEENSMLLVSKLANSPEFSCGSAFGNERTNCVDWDKVIALKENYKDYSGFWGVKGIEVRELSSSGLECTHDNYPSCGSVSLGETKTGVGVSNFVALCHKENLDGLIQDQCKLARLVVYY